MRKLIALCAFAFLSFSQTAAAELVFYEDVTRDIRSLTETQSDYSLVLQELLSEGNEILNSDQKAALSAVGTEPAIAFITAIANGATYNDAVVLLSLMDNITQEQAGELLAVFSYSSQGKDDDTGNDEQLANTDDESDPSATAAGPATGAGITGAPVGSGNGAGGGGGGGLVGSNN